MKFAEFIGQKTLVDAIKKKLSQNKIGHAYLFSGPAGQGKSTLAVLFAKGILCLNRDESGKEVFCDRCLSCSKVDKRIHPDLSFIEPRGKSIKIDQIRELKKELSFKPTESYKKVYVFNEVHTMSLEAANSMLNILEEPPAHVVSILLTTDSNYLLPTILSRCETYNFSAIPPEEMYEYFSNNINFSGKFTEEKLKKAVYLSQGNLKKAKEYLESGFYLELENKVKELLGIILGGRESIALLNWAEYLAGMEEEELEALFELLTLYIREIFVYKVSEKDELLIGFDLWELLSKDISTDSLERIINSLQKTRRYLNYNVNRVLALEGMLLEIKEEIING